MASPTLTALVRRLEDDIPELLTENHCPGLALGITDESETLWCKGFGVLHRDSDQPVTPDTMFSIQSVSKMYTAAATMIAAQQGLLDLEAPITDVLPEFTVHSAFEEHPERAITPRHLLNHRAGFTHEAPVGGNFSRSDSFDAHCETIGDTWLRFPVGHHYSYSNLGIDLMAYALERLTGKAYPDYVREVLLEPLGLSRTTCDHDVLAAEADLAVGHRADGVPEHEPIAILASAGIYTSTLDALAFERMHLGGGPQPLAPNWRERLYRMPFPLPGQAFGYGLGIQLEHWNGSPVRGHGGGGFGYNCSVYWSPEASLGIVVLTNAEGHRLSTRIAQLAHRELVGVRPEPEPGSTGLPRDLGFTEAERRSLPGAYTDGNGPGLRLELDDPTGGLVAVHGETRSPVRRTPEGDLLVESTCERLREELGPDAQVTGLFRMDGSGFLARNEVRPIDPERLVDDPAWNRRYRSARRFGGTSVDIELERDADTAIARLDGEALALREHLPGLWFDPTGEAIDLRHTPPTYGNIALHPDDGQRVRIVHLSEPVFRALAAGDLDAANALGPVPLTAYLAGPESRGTWAMRATQASADPATVGWMTGVIWDERAEVAVGRAGFHGPPDEAGMVEIGYAVDPAHRRRGYARAALEALLARAGDEPTVTTVRVSIAPDNAASWGLASRYGFVRVGEQVDPEDGLEIIYEVAAGGPR